MQDTSIAGRAAFRNIMSRWFTSFAQEKKLGHMNQNDIGRRHCQTYNFRAFFLPFAAACGDLLHSLTSFSPQHAAAA